MAKKIPLRELCSIEITDGTHKTPTYSEEGYIFLSSKNVTTGKINWKDVMYIPEELHNELYKRIAPQKDDILLAKNGTTGVAAIVDRNEIFDIYVSLALIRPNKEKVLPRYLLHAINSEPSKKFFNEHLKGIGVPNLHLTHIRETPISILDFSKQKEIVEKLDKVDELISCRKEQLAKLDELVKARFIELFMGKGYPQKTVDEVSLGKGEYGAQSASVEYDETRPRYVRITDINDDGTLNDDLVASINPADDEQYKLEYGDFMFARMGATVGKTYAFIEGNQIFAGYLIRYRLNQELINPRYLFWYTKLDEYWNWVKLNQSGAAQPGINAKKYGSLQIPLPPIEEQENFAIFVEQTEKTKTEVQKSLDELEILKKSLMQKYFG
ncbi:MAG: restriction endonuclease subunit S [Oscillospiraceae bacterium]|nr:restriction endonuclease subunit S [Oscillospiraceae bacterium]